MVTAGEMISSELESILVILPEMKNEGRFICIEVAKYRLLLVSYDSIPRMSPVWILFCDVEDMMARSLFSLE